MIKVEIKCSGYGASTWETVTLTHDDIERVAIKKLRETDASPTMQVVDVIIVPNNEDTSNEGKKGDSKTMKTGDREVIISPKDEASRYYGVGHPDQAERLYKMLTREWESEQHTEAVCPVLPKINIRCECSDGIVHGSTYLNTVRVEQEDDGSFTAVTDHWPDVEVYFSEPLKKEISVPKYAPNVPCDYGNQDATIQEQYESITGERAIYRVDGADYHTLRYVRWLESRLAEEIKWGHRDCQPDNCMSSGTGCPLTKGDEK